MIVVASITSPALVWAAVTFTTVDSSGNTGWYPSIAFGTDGLPKIAYYYATDGDLRVLSCSNSGCTSIGDNANVGADLTGNVGGWPSIKVDSNNFPVVSYLDETNQDLKVMKCHDTSCAGWNTYTTVDSTGTVGRESSLALTASNIPYISYYDTTNSSLKFARCHNSGCTTSSRVTVDNAASVGREPSIGIGVGGFAVIAYYDETDGDLEFARCHNSGCTTSSITTVDSTGTVGNYASLAVAANGFATISYYDTTNGDLKMARCHNSGCTSSTIRTVDNTGDVGRESSLALTDEDYPVISYYDNTDDDLKVAECSNSGCSSATLSTVDAAGNVGSFTSILLDDHDNAYIAYQDAGNLDLKFAFCTTLDCDATAPDDVSAFDASPTGDDVGLTWTFPVTSETIEAVVVRSTSGYPATYTGGTTVYSGASTSATDSNLSDGTYYYTIFVKDEADNYSDGVNDTAVVSTVSSSSSSAAGGGGGGGGGVRQVTLEMKQEAAIQRFGNVYGSSSSSVSSIRSSAAAGFFTDVPRTSWFYEFIERLRVRDIVSGYKNTAGEETKIFGPGDKVTYGQLAKMVLNLIDRAPSSMKADLHWAEPYVREARKNGLTVFANTSLNLDTTASRGAVVRTILEAYGISLEALPQNTFSDLPDDHPYLQDILTALALSILTGDDGADTVRPDDSINRAELSKILVGVSGKFSPKIVQTSSSSTSSMGSSSAEKVVTETQQSDKDIRHVATAILNVRSDARINASLLWTARQGQAFEVLRIVADDWAHVRVTDGNEGYVWIHHLSK